MARTDDDPSTISVDDAYGMLLRHFGRPAKACARLEAAIRENDVRLLCDGAVVRPGFFATHLCVDVEPDGRAAVKATRALERPESSYDWRIELREVEELVAALQSASVLAPSSVPAGDVTATEAAAGGAVTDVVVPAFPTLEELGLEGQRARPQMKAVWEMTREICGGDARDLSENLSASKLRQMIKARFPHRRSEGGEVPSPDVCEEFMRALRIWRAQQQPPET